ncbi:hypothetical protein C6P40_004328 [Pichia californica]|uniref:Major facilitator superfamily (MFS) profile domain-containing protein n=1 Tax=Pichia californica TaxID=460514 RepID=A0A9P6WQB8_9ASCO|nr:hypothetical protein C6P42_000187 [[Candida] californica]KAG0689858.1 hypothetical protein C6P40_004328 [[Candida] californica]
MFNPTIGEVDPSAPTRKEGSSRRTSNSESESGYASSNANYDGFSDIQSTRSGIIPKAHLKSSFSHPEQVQKTGSLSFRKYSESIRNKDALELDEFTFEENPIYEEGNEPITELENNTSVEVDMDDDALYPKGWQPKLVVLGSFLSCFTLFGLMNAIGAIEAYVQEHQLAAESVSSVSWIFSIYMFVSLFLGLLVGPLYDTFGATYLLLTGSIMTFVGLFSCGSATTVYQFILSFGVCSGIGTGFLMFPAISTISSWFVKSKRPFYIGLAQTGGSVGGIFFPIMLRFLYEKYGFEWAMRIFAFFNLGVTLVGVVLTRDRLKELRKLTNEPEDDRTFLMKLKGSIDLNYFKDKKFMALTSALFMNEFALLIVLTYLASYAIAYGASTSESYTMLTILNVAGTFGKFIPSYFAQRYGCFNMMILMSVSMTLECFIIWLPFGKHKGALYTFIVLFGFAYSATYSLTGATVGAITSKTKDFGKRYGSAYAIVSFGNLISLPISGAFIVNKTTSDYNNMVAFASACCGLASVLFIVSRWTVVGKKINVAI